MARTVCASTFGGPGDPGTGHKGYKGDNLSGKKAFAELGMGTLLGNVPYKSWAQITYKGKSVMAQKLDIGAGGAPCGGHIRAVDIWWETARELGFSGLDTVSILTEVSPAEAKKLEENLTNPGLTGQVEKGVKTLEDVAKGPLEWTKDLSKILTFLLSSSGWLRIGKVVLGVALMLIAISELTKISPAGPAVGVAKKVVKK